MTNRELAARILATAESELARPSDLSLTLQVDCQAVHYWAGDLFIQVLRLAEAHQADQRQAMRLSVLRGELRAMLTADAGEAPEGDPAEPIDAGKVLSFERVKRGAEAINKTVGDAAS